MFDQEHLPFSTEDEAILLEICETAEETGPLQNCNSEDTTWYSEAVKDKQRYLKIMESLEKEEEALETPEKQQEEEEEENLLISNRADSYGESWEDQDLTNWQPEAILKRSRVKGERHYLVKWKLAKEPTWETYEDLEEEGHAWMVKDFDNTKAAVKTTNPPKKEKEEKEKREKLKKKEPPISVFNPEVYWPDFEEKIKKSFNDRYMNPEEIINVCQKDLAEPFSKKLGSDMTPVMLFHGTAAHNIKPIIETGLRIPGKGNKIAVANGSAFGVGIYTGTGPQISDNYTRGCGYMFVCAGLIGGVYSTSVKQPGGACVFFDASLVLPCFVVKYSRSSCTTPCFYTPVYTEAWLSGFGLPPPPPVIEKGRVNPLVSTLMQKYRDGLAASSDAPTSEKFLVSGSKSHGSPYSKELATLTKKQLRALPRSAKELYRQGLLKQRKC
eukprot:TRINITY_DN27443_c0_g1_i1.p1 TRINITY_DN27443_c0_g1~~TRINITY_DN27443_c0_g1_i1.p1  ORF type:complete len:454 (+),score=110.88 TRINITY_DN27443_c0_g1_i1:42-1364(+)